MTLRRRIGAGSLRVTSATAAGVDLSLQPGRCLGLVGRNGAGKSTLVSILSGLYPPDAGEVHLDGRPAPSLGDIAAWRGRIATVFLREPHRRAAPGRGDHPGAGGRHPLPAAR